MPNMHYVNPCWASASAFLGWVLVSGRIPLRLIDDGPSWVLSVVELVVFDATAGWCLWVLVGLRYFSTESLILAQDERWRRA